MNEVGGGPGAQGRRHTSGGQVVAVGILELGLVHELVQARDLLDGQVLGGGGGIHPAAQLPHQPLCTHHSIS